MRRTDFNDLCFYDFLRSEGLLANAAATIVQEVKTGFVLDDHEIFKLIYLIARNIFNPEDSENIANAGLDFYRGLDSLN